MTRTATLRLSLLVSLGLVPIACSGKTLETRDDDEGGSANQSGRGGTTSLAGKPSKGGLPPTDTGGATTGGATTAGGTAGKAGATSTGGAGGSFGCTDGQLDPITGLVACKEGYKARPAAKACDDPNGVGGVPSGQGGEGGAPDATNPRADGSVSCSDDSACVAFALGYCQIHPFGVGGVCLSGCLEDADCGDGSLCDCSPSSGHGGTCVPSDCRTNADCGAGFVCASYQDPCGSVGFACTTAKDTCPSDACASAMCTFQISVGHRACNDAACGRPFLVEQQARVAPVVPTAAWSDHLTPRVDHLTTAKRAALAAHWTKLGQMEHASIAAFARFQLQLLALGAPADLVRACNQALVDETNHTRLCFGLASAYAGRSIGPGALDVSHSLDVTSLADIVDLVIAEGCIGETNAALEALEAADAATDPVIRSAYARIAEDEQRHAELAFRFVRWALTRDARIATRVERALSDLPHLPAFSDVVRPCLRAVLAA